MLKVNESPSASVAATVPMLVWFSAPLYEVPRVKTGELSLRLLIFTVTSRSVFAIEPSAVIVIRYEDFVSKSGAELKVSTPEEVSILIESASLPDTEYVTASPNGSSAATMPISVWFSSALKLDGVEKIGPSGSTSVILTWISWLVTISPSEALSCAEKEAIVSKSGRGLNVKAPEAASTLTLGKLLALGVASLPIPAWILQ